MVTRSSAASAPPRPEPPPGGPGPGRAPLPRAERQEAILRGAARAFVRAGFAATSMEDIAAESGITKLIVYRHFSSKEELYRAVLQRVFDQLAGEFVARVMHADGRGGVGAGSLLAVARSDPDGFRLLWEHAAREPRFADYAQELRERAVDASRAAVRGRVDEQLREWAAQTVVSYLVAATLSWMAHGDPAADEEFVTLATRGARAAIASWSVPAGA